ncbi:YceI family protein [Litoreibacter roseus]|nr:YceI family protein [Litoreibacter roseus]
MRTVFLCLFWLATATLASAANIDRDASTLGFSVEIGSDTKYAIFGDWRATITTQETVISRVEVIVDIASASFGDRLFDSVMLSPAWLDVGNHPEALFVADLIESSGAGLHTATGSLTLNGHERSLAVTIREVGASTDQTFNVSAQVQRLDFGMTDTAVPVAPIVTITGRVRLLNR